MAVVCLCEVHLYFISNSYDKILDSPLAMTKLMGYQYKICYKKGNTNCPTDALSRATHSSATLATKLVALPTWLQTLQHSHTDNLQDQQLLSSLASHNPHGQYTLGIKV